MGHWTGSDDTAIPVTARHINCHVLVRTSVASSQARGAHPPVSVFEVKNTWSFSSTGLASSCRCVRFNTETAQHRSRILQRKIQLYMHYLKQPNSSAADKLAASEEIPKLVRNPNFPFRVCKSPVVPSVVLVTQSVSSLSYAISFLVSGTAHTVPRTEACPVQLTRYPELKPVRYSSHGIPN